MSSYRRGVKAEYDIIQYFKTHRNAICIRSAGSHSPVDVIAGDGINVWCIQVKYGEHAKKPDIEGLKRYAILFKAIPVVATRVPRGEWTFDYVKDK